jgi:hypothetical protein
VLVARPFVYHARFAALIALALMTKALVPAGWMPFFDNGTIALRLCGGWTPQPTTQPAAQAERGMSMEHEASASAHHDRNDEEHQSSDQPCSFAAAGLAWAALDSAGTAEPPLQGSTMARSFPRAVAVGRGLAAPPPPSTGPPLLT